MAISYTMSKQDKLSLRKPVQVVGARTLSVPVAGFGTVGIGGVDAVISGAVASSLGLPRDNAIVISAPRSQARRPDEQDQEAGAAPNSAVAALVTQIIAGTSTVTTAAAGDMMSGGQQGPGLTSTELTKFLAAAESRIGMPYVWGGSGPTTFDCSGLVQWSLARPAS